MMEFTMCIIIRHPPYGTVLPAEAYRTIQALQTFEREVNVLFVADGALTLVESTDPEPIGMHCLADAFVDLLALPGVSLAVNPDSLERRGFTVDDLISLPEGSEYTLVDDDQIETFMSGHKSVIVF
jgi:sulfur relay (sulfurtransferase) DsrF/TusC family protein